MLNGKTLIARAETILLTRHHLPLEEANASQLHEAIGQAAMEALTPAWMKTIRKRENKRRACYLSAEYLTGRMVYNNLFCLGLLDEAREALKQKGVDIAVMEDVEDDAFGNGGLGRLAACFLDSAATLNVPLDGYGLRYRYGLFKQVFEQDGQKEEPDDWAKYGDPWSLRRDEESVIVPMKCGDVRAVPYDMPIVGYAARSIGTLRLWQCESLHEIDFALFNQQKYAAAAADKNRAEDITKFLYPNDSTREGKLLRLRQQYVLSSASLQDMLRAYRREHGSDYSRLAALYAVQLNDTHPTLSIPELIRLLGEDGVSFEAACRIAEEMFSFTNHTVMAEALECWDMSLIRALSPQIATILKRIDARFEKLLKSHGLAPTDRLCIIRDDRVHMANLAIYMGHAINGVAELHTNILKNDVFAAWYDLFPERFQNKTNGITQRRWLGLCNPELCQLLEKRIGGKYITDLYELRRIRPMIDNELARQFHQVKQEKKRQLRQVILKQEGVDLPETMLYDVQVKRLHEYKRQLMNALSILAIYYQLKDGTLTDFTPTAFIFGAKAAPGYDRAKSIIRFINLIADKVNADPETNERLKVVFVHNYNCSYAEHIIPAADVSEQISPAGTEASGTGNMKFMLNGAVTLGTFDGANVEIVEQAGVQNNYIFGETVETLQKKKPTYVSRELYQRDKLLRRVIDTLVDGTFPDDEKGGFKELYTALLDGASWHKPDHYFVLLDFESYLAAKLQANRDYRDTLAFAKKCLENVSGAGKFSSDRTITQYAREIWRV